MPDLKFIILNVIWLEVDIKVEQPSKDPMALADRIDELETMLWTMRETCQKCRNPEGNTILCDKCENGWHTTCLNPPLKNIPEGKYYFKSSSKQNSNKKSKSKT